MTKKKVKKVVKEVVKIELKQLIIKFNKDDTIKDVIALYDQIDSNGVVAFPNCSITLRNVVDITKLENRIKNYVQQIEEMEGLRS